MSKSNTAISSAVALTPRTTVAQAGGVQGNFTNFARNTRRAVGTVICPVIPHHGSRSIGTMHGKPAFRWSRYQQSNRAHENGTQRVAPVGLPCGLRTPQALASSTSVVVCAAAASRTHTSTEAVSHRTQRAVNARRLLDRDKGKVLKAGSKSGTKTNLNHLAR
jgi:hypothetical protein